MLMMDILPWMDKNRMVKPQKEWSDSGNGILYSSIYILFLHERGQITLADKEWYISIVKSCYKTSGVLMRNPENSFGLQQWDDYIGVAIACFILGEKKIPREILWHGVGRAVELFIVLIIAFEFVFHGHHHGIIFFLSLFLSVLSTLGTKNFMFFDSKGEHNWGAFLGRFVHVWPLMWCAAFPFLKWVLEPELWLIGQFMKTEALSDNQTQLTWLYFRGCANLGFRFKKYDELLPLIPVAMAKYYGPGMPFIEESKNLK